MDSAAPRNDSALALDASGLVKRFGERTALAAIDLSIPTRTRHAILGPNGSGKSTLFRIAATLLRPDAGTIRIAGFDAVTDSDRVRREIGVVFQRPSLDGKLTALENLGFAGRIHGLSRTEARERALALLERLEVADRRDDRVDTLSGGLARRIEIAKALLPRPSLLLLDEPSTGLDPNARARLQSHLRALRDDGVTVIQTTHLFDEADDCDAVTILDRGKVVAHGEPKALAAEVGDIVLRVAGRDPIRARDALIAATGETPRGIAGEWQASCRDPAASAAQVARALGTDLLRLEIARPSLADLFASRTGHTFDTSAESST